MTRASVLAAATYLAATVALGVTLAACAGTGGTAVATPDTVTVTAPAETVTVTVSAASSAPDDPAGDTTAESAPASSPDDSAIPGLQSEGTGVDPCKLVAQHDAEVLAAMKLDPPQKVQQTCTYTAPVTGSTGQVQVFIGPGAKKQLDVERTLSHPLRKLPATGDEAWAGDSAIYVRKGALWVSVELVLLNDPSENARPLAHLATVIAGRM